jgi:hypothetical protein
MNAKSNMRTTAGITQRKSVKNFPKDVAIPRTKMTAQRNKNVAQSMKINVPESLKENAKI